MRRNVAFLLVVYCFSAHAQPQQPAALLTSGEFSYALVQDDRWRYGYKSVDPDPALGMKVWFQPCYGTRELLDAAYVIKVKEANASCSKLPRGPDPLGGPRAVVFSVSQTQTPNLRRITVLDTGVDDPIIAVGKSWVVPVSDFANKLNFGDSGRTALLYRTQSTWMVSDQNAFAKATGAIPDVINVSGNVLTDARGMTLYTWTNDTVANRSTCEAGCIQTWPALGAREADKDMGEWKVITRPDGAKQWAYKGKPLYYFIMDKAAGERAGEGRGSVWQVAKP
jgi:predicted lipoprotein with Yx(FWY)xxD motif